MEWAGVCEAAGTKTSRNGAKHTLLGQRRTGPTRTLTTDRGGCVLLSCWNPDNREVASLVPQLLVTWTALPTVRTLSPLCPRSSQPRLDGNERSQVNCAPFTLLTPRSRLCFGFSWRSGRSRRRRLGPLLASGGLTSRRALPNPASPGRCLEASGG